ncbi:MAG: hypothetical protein O3A20_04715 [Planctomycetota bacterium]|nr:hypothetical protein [Planctomycetota bacterium]
MKTIDFLPQAAFATHLERRRTPARIAIVATYALLCGGAAVAVEAETRGQEQTMLNAEAPNAVETVARQELRTIYAEMNSYADRLDPLAAHLRMPTAAPLLANLGDAVGEQVLIEEIAWEHKSSIKSKQIEYAEMHLTIKALVHGDSTLLELPEQLRQTASMQHARTATSELVPGLRDTMRAKVSVVGELLLPGMTAAKLNPETPR